jgi:hypothetical protein
LTGAFEMGNSLYRPPKSVKSLKLGLKEAKAGKLHSFKDAFGEEP